MTRRKNKNKKTGAGDGGGDGGNKAEPAEKTVDVDAGSKPSTSAASSSQSRPSTAWNVPPGGSGGSSSSSAPTASASSGPVSPPKEPEPAPPPQVQNPWIKIGGASLADKLKSAVKISDEGGNGTGAQVQQQQPRPVGPWTNIASPQTSRPPSASHSRSSSTSRSSGGGDSARSGKLVVLEEINESLKVVTHQPQPADPSTQRPHRSLNDDKGTYQHILVEANHFPVKFNKQFPETVYHYDVVITPKDRREGEGDADRELNETTVPDRLLHVVWKEFEERYHKKLGARMPFDGKKNCYSAKRLQFDHGHAWVDEFEMDDPDDDGKKRTFRVQLKYTNPVPTPIMWEYLKSCNSKEHVELPQDVIQSLDVALRYSPSLKFFPCNRSFFSSHEPFKISGLLELYFGHNQSLILGRDEKAFLNIDMANKAFIKRQSLTDIINFVLRKKFDEKELVRRNWNGARYRTVNDFLKGKLLEYKTIEEGKLRRHRFVCVEVVPEDSTSFKFNYNGKLINIAEYFDQEKGVKLKHPNWPVVHIGTKKLKNYVPLELLEVTPQPYKGKLESKDTAEMIKGAAKPPEDRFRRIKTSMEKSCFNESPAIKEFGMEVEKETVKINAKKIGSPRLRFVDDRGRQCDENPRFADGKFRIGKFLEPAKIPKVGILNTTGVWAEQDDQYIRNFMKNLASDAQHYGLTPKYQGDKLEPMFNNAFIFNVDMKKKDHLRSALTECKKRYGGDVLVIVFMHDEGKEYPLIKSEAEVRVGVLTQCVKWCTLGKSLRGPYQKGKNQVLYNILQKINAKLGGKNFSLGSLDRDLHFLIDPKEPILFLGADVTHPAPNSKSPSVAAITGSIDLSGMRYQMHIQLQPHSGNAQAQEVITGLSAIIEKMIQMFAERTGGVYPKKIIMYRDGVSEGQFPEIKKKEFYGGIKAAIDRINGPQFNPKVTFVIVKKRHHTRFTPVNPKEGVAPKGNIPPGTVVDVKITHPIEKEFYLNSHVGIQGCSKPTRYHVLHDDSNFSMDQLEKMTFYLCFMFSRCSQPVSYPAPTYYAHRAAFRAKNLIENEGQENVDVEYLRTKIAVDPQFKKIFPMFFV